MILPTVKLRVTRPHRARTLRLAVAKHIPGGYDVLLGQDFTSPSKPRQFWGSNSLTNPPNPSPVPCTASVPMPRPQPDLPSGESRLSTPLPVPLGRTEQCQSPSVQTDETTTTSLPAPVPMSVPEHAPDPPPRDPTPNVPSSPGLVPLPVSVTRETGSPDPSGGSTKGTDSQPRPELVTTACESTTPPLSIPSFSPPATDTFASHNSALPRWADELCKLRRLMSELANKIPVSVVAAADPDGTPCHPSASGPPIPRPRTSVQGREACGGITPGVGDHR
ncbi:uncharacterized protein [Macrobrachium rosenbergii]|uniref:uncharacterized protein n=1 Tax=Macrobrachium rosenbergii TaxID=79674 RepID=UPI0034D5DFC2